MPAMMKPKKTPAAPGKLPDVTVESRPVLYPELTVNGVPIPPEKTKLTAPVLKKLMGWETEPEYKKRCEAMSDPHERAKGVAGFGDEYTCFDTDGNKVRCWNNLDNRSFDEATAGKYRQDELNREWAGQAMSGNRTAAFPLPDGGTIDLPLYTVNGETFIVSRTGKVHSGQHRGVGAVLAAEMWHKNPKGYPLWTEEPYIETLVVFGVTDDPRVVKTLDNCRPRTLADVIQTSDTFKRKADGTLIGQAQRKELSRMLDAGIDTLWRRTAAGGENEPGRQFQTHSASFDFLDRHPAIMPLVKHLFECNADRKISLLQLSSGQCAAACYLMAASASDIDEYLKDRTEKRLDFSNRDKAEEFFTALADGGDRSFKVVREALGALKSLDEGLGGRVQEKMATLAAAWARFQAGEEIRAADLKLSYGEDKNGNPVLLDPPTFGGIDQGHDPDPPELVTPKQAEAAKAKAAQKKAGDALKATKAGKGQGGSALETLAELKKDHPGKVLLFRDDGGDYNTYAEDAEALAANMGSEPRKGPGGIALYCLPATYYETAVRQMVEAGSKPAVVRFTDGVAEVVDVQPRKAGPKPKPGPVQPAPVKPAEARVNGTAKPAAKPKPVKKGGPKLKGGIGS